MHTERSSVLDSRAVAERVPCPSHVENLADRTDRGLPGVSVSNAATLAEPEQIFRTSGFSLGIESAQCPSPEIVTSDPLPFA